MIMSLVFTALSTYGLTYLLTHQDGPLGIFLKLQQFKLFQCFYCTAFWVALLLTIPFAISFLTFTILALATVGAVYIIYEVVEPL